MIIQWKPSTLCIEAGSTFPSEVPDVGIADWAEVAVDLTIFHAERNEAAAAVSQAQAIQRRFYNPYLLSSNPSSL